MSSWKSLRCCRWGPSYFSAQTAHTLQAKQQAETLAAAATAEAHQQAAQAQQAQQQAESMAAAAIAEARQEAAQAKQQAEKLQARTEQVQHASLFSTDSHAAWLLGWVSPN